MKFVLFRTSSIPSITKMLAVFFLVVILGACGSNSAATSAPTGTTPGSAGKVPVDAPSVLTLNKANISVDVGSLRIQSTDGFQCPFHTKLGTVTGQLVLSSDRTTYTQAEIDQIRSYVAQDPSPNVTPPPTLRWVLGGSIGTIPGGETRGGPGSSSCGAVVKLTNRGNSPIQIPQIGVQLTASPQQNTYQYHLINVCSFRTIDPNAVYTGCPPTAGGGGDCRFYHATIPLGFGKKNDVYSAVPQPDGQNRDGTTCSILTLAPAAQVQLTITFSLAPNTPDNLIYSLEPVFTVITTQGQQTVALSQLASTFAFANASQFSCYELQGTTIALAKPPTPSTPYWCV